MFVSVCVSSYSLLAYNNLDIDSMCSIARIIIMEFKNYLLWLSLWCFGQVLLYDS